MSLKLNEEMEKRAMNRVGNIYTGTVAMLRGRLVRWLGILADNASAKTKAAIAEEAYILTSFLMRRKRLAEAVRQQLRTEYPEFDPELHYAKTVRDQKGKIISSTPIIKVLPKLEYPRHIYHICAVHDMLVDRWLESLELFADGLYQQSGTAIIQRMLDYSGRTNYVFDTADAELLAGEIFEDERPALPEGQANE